MFQGFVSFLLPCFAVDHLYLCYDEYLFSEEETPITDGNFPLFSSGMALFVLLALTVKPAEN